MVNKVTIIGYIGKDPEVRRLENGAAVAKFSVATSEAYKDTAGEWQERTEWHNIILWRFQAEKAEKSFKKGNLVYIEGKLQTRKWTDANNVERWSTDVIGHHTRKINTSPKGDSSFPTAADAPAAKAATTTAATPTEPRETPVTSETPAEEGGDLPF